MKALKPDIDEHRTPDHPVDPVFVNRWSPRAMSGEPISDAELMTLFEAVRWAPSSFNEQPWRLVYATRGTAHWQAFYDLLVPFNQGWCANAAVLVVWVSRTAFERSGKPNPVHAFDCGAAWENLALQASIMGLVAHGMVGFDFDRARRDLGVPEGFEVRAMCAIGRPGRTEDLAPELREREVPSGRKPIRDFAFEGRFGTSQSMPAAH